ncbi:hypothetical protein [Pseudovibrio sp. SCP19]|uniref:hypothetical protein n=1 Tax=Pseudovibrio sp. SCP19 TaxID=3141374 RepID=UPI00333744B7
MQTGSEACAFCNEVRELRESHIVPKFVFRWLKNSGVSPYLRNHQNPNKKVQDGVKIPLLCNDCEQLFEKYETPFAKFIFRPFVDDPTYTVMYSDWCAKFAASVMWRAGTFFLLTSSNGLPVEVRQQIEAACDVWRTFILGASPNPSQYELHMVPFDLIESSVGVPLHKSLNTYLQRIIDTHLFGFTDANSQIISVKLGPIGLFGFVSPPRDKWAGSRIKVRSGQFKLQNLKLPLGLFQYLNYRSEVVFEQLESMSDVQKSKVMDMIEEHSDAFFESNTYRAMLQDIKLSS